MLVGLLTLSSPIAHAHGLEYSLEHGTAVVVRTFHPDRRAFSSKAYEIFRVGEEAPYQNGHTDQEGRIVFLPDRPGTWQIKTYSEDGHGLSITLETDAAHRPSGIQRPLLERYAQPLVGLGVLFGLFGLVSLFYRRKAA